MHEDRLRLSDHGILILLCSLLFGVSLVAGRVLTMHEAVLPQSAREMDAANEWVAPLSAGRPWLERPPLPQWITIAVAHLVGRFDAEWVVRIPSVLVATLSVLLLASTVSFWYGRSLGVLSGLCLATSFEFVRYAWLAEQDIYLCAIITASIAVFVRMEFGAHPPGPRSRWIWPWFVLLGMTNLAKGLIFGTAMALIPVAAFLLWNWDWSVIRRYTWNWGWAIALAVAAVWPIAVLFRYPDVASLWHFDLVGRLTGEYTAINEPVWYYWANLPLVTMPWSPLAVVGLALTAPAAFRRPRSPERFLWCWSLAPLAVFTIPGGKHHHYMLACLAPWAVFSALGLARLRAWTLRWPSKLKTPLAGAVFVGLPLSIVVAWFGPRLDAPPWIVVAVVPVLVGGATVAARGLHHARPYFASATLFASVVILYAGGLVFTARYLDECRNDTHFFHQVAKTAREQGKRVVVNADQQSMDVFRILFYMGPSADPIHNLTFLRDARFEERSVLVLSRTRDLERLQTLGRVRVLSHSDGARREISPADRFALFELEFDDEVDRLVNNTRVSPMQAMDRESGPYLGGPLESRNDQKRRPIAQTAN